jgi:hypothetical protein
MAALASSMLEKLTYPKPLRAPESGSVGRRTPVTVPYSANISWTASAVASKETLPTKRVSDGGDWESVSTGSIGLGGGVVDVHCAAVELSTLLGVESLDGVSNVGELDVAESTGAVVVVTVNSDADTSDVTEALKLRAKVVLVDVPGKVADEEVGGSVLRDVGVSLCLLGRSSVADSLLVARLGLALLVVLGSGSLFLIRIIRVVAVSIVALSGLSLYGGLCRGSFLVGLLIRRIVGRIIISRGSSRGLSYRDTSLGLGVIRRIVRVGRVIFCGSSGLLGSTIGGSLTIGLCGNGLSFGLRVRGVITFVLRVGALNRRGRRGLLALLGLLVRLCGLLGLLARLDLVGDDRCGDLGVSL